ncbi:MAG: hypothetical protein ACSHW1_18830 [Yoonia sp.]|uniref:hypothetical protein n=1 Tax=Yoonia sp. TaxID=2212373 RepID=UPI003EF9285B
MQYLLTLGACAVMGLPQPAHAQDCRHDTLITAMADHRINAPLPALTSTDTQQLAWAAYYKTHYDSLAGEEIETMFDQIAWETPDATAIEQLRAIYALSEPGGLAAWAGDDAATLTTFRTASPALIRALILADGGDTFLRLRAATAPETETSFPTFSNGPRPALYLTDQPEGMRIALALKSEAAGAYWLAGALWAGMSDPMMLNGFMTRHADLLSDLPEDGIWRFAPYSATVQDRMIAARVALNQDTQLPDEIALSRAAAATFPISFLGIYHGQSGAQPSSYPAAYAVLDAVQTDTIDPLTSPETLWLVAYHQLLETAAPDDVRRILSQFDLDAGRNWYPRTDALFQLDAMAATALLGAYAQGEGDTVPPAPDVTSLDWVSWAAAADLLRDGALLAAFDENAVATTELLWAADKYAVAWGLALADSHDAVDTAQLAADLVVRLDMQCGQHTIVSGLYGQWGRERLMHFP